MFEKFSNSFLKDFDFNLLIDRFENKSFRTYLKGDSIIKQGNSPSEIYFIISGKVKIGNTLTDGKLSTQYELTGGDILGIDDALRNENYSYTAVADDDTNVMVISKEEMLSFKGTNDEFNIWLLKYLSDRISKLEDKKFRPAMLNFF
ncbi:MAG: cyclic nucleotide-binding domain-containing protein [Ignavibacteria bacterium]|nr:cyclic nucleotide-binding domain-containing protein [Ignavibacteria bacterium]